jgi:FkbM family methyltransferase
MDRAWNTRSLSGFMLVILYRALRFASRFIVGLHHFGLCGAVRVFLLSRWQGVDSLTQVPIRPMQRKFAFRSVSDRGVLCMFYNEGYRIIDSYGRRAKVIIDGGANIGDSTMRFRRFHPQARILAIEADADNAAVLRQNFADDDKVTCLHRALWSESGTVQIQKTWANVASRITQSTEVASCPVPASSVPDLMREFQVDVIDILKLDIEGAESVVFQTADTSWMQRVRCIIFECCDADDAGTTAKIFAALHSAGGSFNCHIAGENLVLIRTDTPWHLGTDLWLDERATVAPHIAEGMELAGLARID